MNMREVENIIDRMIRAKTYNNPKPALEEGGGGGGGGIIFQSPPPSASLPVATPPRRGKKT
jgi:hypothetical protein